MTQRPMPPLSGAAAEAVGHRGTHVQLIAGAGSGKTETMAQRIASILAEGASPASVVAFTFTVRAASELKQRVHARLQEYHRGLTPIPLTHMYIGTIHGYCFDLLTKRHSIYENYNVLDSIQELAFLARVANSIDLRTLGQPSESLFGLGQDFLRSVAVVENEALDLTSLQQPFRSVLEDYYGQLDQHRYITFGQLVTKARELLASSPLEGAETVRHLFVDEYQDVNPAQEALIDTIVGRGGAEITVVGDDDQAIYQWRGSTVENIVTFASRYQNATRFDLLENRRSKPDIVQAANAFAATIPGRLPKAMAPTRRASGPAVVAHQAATEADEACWIASEIARVNSSGTPLADIAILIRSRAALPAIIEALEDAGIPIKPPGRSGLLLQPDGEFLGQVIAHLAGTPWRQRRFGPITPTVDAATVIARATAIYDLDVESVAALDRTLTQLRTAIAAQRPINLVSALYELLSTLGVAGWPVDASGQRRLGILARFLTVVADYEAVQMRARKVQIGQTGARADSRKSVTGLGWLLFALANDIEDFTGDISADTDAVNILTIHASKGLEWPLVFVPSLTSSRFPTSRAGRQQRWLVGRSAFDASRYEGGDADERRLFYVALTRAADCIVLSSHTTVGGKRRAPSPYLTEVLATATAAASTPAVSGSQRGLEVPEYSFSDVAAYLECGYSYLLRQRLGFPSPLVPEIGFGSAVHHLLRALADMAREAGASPNEEQLAALLAAESFFPFAGQEPARKLMDRAREMVEGYTHDYPNEPALTTAVERPFRLDLGDAVITGRADVVVARPDFAISIGDFKTRHAGAPADLQVQTYSLAAEQEGISVEPGFVHDLASRQRRDVPVDSVALSEARDVLVSATQGLRSGAFHAAPEVNKCKRCDVAPICVSRAP